MPVSANDFAVVAVADAGYVHADSAPPPAVARAQRTEYDATPEPESVAEYANLSAVDFENAPVGDDVETAGGVESEGFVPVVVKVRSAP